MKIRWRKPNEGSLDYLIVARVLEVTIGKLEIAFYWHYGKRYRLEEE